MYSCRSLARWWILFFAPASDKQKKNVIILGKLFVNQYYPVTLESFPWATERFEEGGIVYRRIPSLGIPRGAALSFQVVGGWGGEGNFIIIVFLGWKIWSIDKSLSTRQVSGKSIGLSYPLDSDLSSGYCYLPFWQMGPVLNFWGYLAPFQLHLKMRKSHNILMLRMCFSNWIMSAMILEVILDQTEMRMWYVTSSQLKQHRNNNIIYFKVGFH